MHRNTHCELCYFSQFILVAMAYVMLSSSNANAFEQVQFLSNGQKVDGWFFAATNPKHTVLLLQGFPGSPEDVLGLGERLSKNEINVLTFNYRGTFESEGTYGLANTQEDIQSALDFLCEPGFSSKHGIVPSQIIIGGYSYGGGMALTYVANHADIKRVFSIAGTDHGEFARRFKADSSYASIFDSLFKSLEAPSGPVRFDGEKVLAELADNAELYDLRLVSRELSKKDLLIIGGLNDPNVTLEEHLLPLYRELVRNGAASLQFEVLSDNHSFSKTRDDLADMVANWISGSP